MAKTRDRTEDFKDAVHRAALSLCYSEVCKPFEFLLFRTLLKKPSIEFSRLNVFSDFKACI